MINRSNDNNYHWDYEDYQGNYGQSPARGKKNSNRGLRVFLIMMGAVHRRRRLGQQTRPAAGSGFVHRQ